MEANDPSPVPVPLSEFRAEASARRTLARLARVDTKRLLQEIQGNRDWSSLGLPEDESTLENVLALAIESLQHAPGTFSKHVRDVALIFACCEDESIREAMIYGSLPHSNSGFMQLLEYMANQDPSPRVRHTASMALQAVTEADRMKYESEI